MYAFFQKYLDHPGSPDDIEVEVLEEKEFERVGGNTIIKSDFRLIAASNQNLEEMLADRRFRKDLFYRLNVIPLHVPPLRERKSDVQVLVGRETVAALEEEIRRVLVP